MSLEEPEDTNAQGLKQALDKSFAKQQFTFPRQAKQIGNGSDGAAVNTALFELEKAELGEHLMKGWCANHKSQLGTTDSFKHSELNSNCETDLSNIFYFFRKANLKWRLMKRQARFMEVPLLKYKRPNGTRWVSHQVISSENYLRNIHIFIAFCNQQIATPHNKTMKDAVPKIKGFLKNAAKLERLIYLAVRKDILAYLSPFSQCLEKQTLLMPEAITAMKGAIATLERLLRLIKDKGSAVLYLDSYFPCLAQIVWPYLDRDDPNQYEAERRQRNAAQSEAELSDYPVSFHGYSMTTTLDKALSIVIKDVETSLENLVTNLKKRFSEYLESDLYSAIATLLDTKSYQHKTPLDIMPSVNTISKHFSVLLQANGCKVLGLQAELDIIHAHVTTFLKSARPEKVWPQLFTSANELCIQNILHVAEIGIVAPISSAEVERVFSHFAKIVGKERQSLKNSTIEDLLVIRSQGISVENNALYESTVNDFLTKYPDGEIRKRVRRPGGYNYKLNQKKRKTTTQTHKSNCLFLPLESNTSGDTDSPCEIIPNSESQLDSDSDTEFTVSDIDLEDISSTDSSESDDSDSD